MWAKVTRTRTQEKERKGRRDERKEKKKERMEKNGGREKERKVERKTQLIPICTSGCLVWVLELTNECDSKEIKPITFLLILHLPYSFQQQFCLWHLCVWLGSLLAFFPKGNPYRMWSAKAGLNYVLLGNGHI